MNTEWLAGLGRSYGFDLTAVGPAIGRALGRRNLARASVTAVPFPSGAFDLVASFDVLYSLPDDAERQAIEEMWRVLKPGGYVLVNVAAMDILRGDHSILSHELRRYSRAQLRGRLSAQGFEIVRLTYTNQTLFLPMLAVRTLHRWRGLSGEADADQEIQVPPAPINAVLSALLWLESRWLRRFDTLAGSSLMCLARKPA